ncbi:hypothetical protein EVG20_g9189 [Dentipellis fragilis]|uniref:Uncharacterized protein n=1 Tax=Dentipellis fragilis TaxID=205917 RepID=A0A4Y9Y4S3_9AGAM|nr:hypothetical protein EVG20_g9189 [Dentipellis fragilis]
MPMPHVAGGERERTWWAWEVPVPRGDRANDRPIGRTLPIFAVCLWSLRPCPLPISGRINRTVARASTGPEPTSHGHERQSTIHKPLRDGAYVILYLGVHITDTPSSPLPLPFPPRPQLLLCAAIPSPIAHRPSPIAPAHHL